MINSFTLAGVNSYTGMGLIIEKRPQPVASIQRYEAVEVEGRDDTLFMPKGNYVNVPLVYQVACSDINRYLPIIRLNLIDNLGYVKLTDTYTTGGFYRAFISNPIQFSEDLLNFGHANVEFSASPWFYLNSGETGVPIGATTTSLTNPEPYYKALPLIEVTGTAGQNITLYIRSRQYSFKIPTGKTKITIDCLSETAYDNDGQNAVKYLNFEEFPYLDDKNIITVSRLGGSAMTLTPRWRRLI